jgi:N-sulfoglucosamine sulfohydrolase
MTINKIKIKKSTKVDRRKFLKMAGSISLISFLSSHTEMIPFSCLSRRERPNFLLLTADDMNYNSPGCYGCEIPDITPNIDGLARQGMKFTNAHVNIAVCQPSRQSIMTGRYPHRNGAEGFEAIDLEVRTLQESLNKAGYLNGIMGKEKHLEPRNKFYWDFYIQEQQLASGAGIGRNPSLYHNYAKTFFNMAKKEQKPFFLMANSHDPHRPFAGSDQELKNWGKDLPEFKRQISPEEVPVPGFLPDLPNVHKEIAEYYTSVHRCDQSIGAVLRALKDTGLEENTLVIFISDNGMSLPFAKANCYLNSTKTPWIVRWPGRVQPGTIDTEHLISGIDFMPTILDAARLPKVDELDGFSFLPLLSGVKQNNRTEVYTEFHQTFARNRYPMRCVQNKQFGYIFNFWAGKTDAMRMDSTSGRTFRAMQEAGITNPEIAARIRLFEYRVPEEFYDFYNDPDALNNLIDDRRYQKDIDRMRKLLRERMTGTNDPALEAFLKRDDPAIIDKFMKEQQQRAKSGT